MAIRAHCGGSVAAVVGCPRQHGGPWCASSHMLRDTSDQLPAVERTNRLVNETRALCRGVGRQDRRETGTSVRRNVEPRLNAFCTDTVNRRYVAFDNCFDNSVNTMGLIIVSSRFVHRDITRVKRCLILMPRLLSKFYVLRIWNLEELIFN